MNKKIYFAIVLILALVSESIAEDKLSDYLSRFSGRIEFGGFYANSDSQVIAFDVDGIDKRINDLGESEADLALGAPLLLFDVSYEVKDDLLVYFGTPFFMDSREGLSLGFEKLFDNGTVLDMALFGETTGSWKDPYLTNVDRDFTYNHEVGLNFMFSDILGSNFIFNYVASIHHVDDDISGDNNSRLERKGHTQKFKPGYAFILSEDLNTTLTTSLIYERNHSAGEAYIYDKAGAEFSLAIENEKNSIAFSASSEATNFNNENPVFGKKIRDKSYSGNAIYSRKNLWDTDWYLRIGGGVNYLDSNADFFDHFIYLTGMTVGIAFE